MQRSTTVWWWGCDWATFKFFQVQIMGWAHNFQSYWRYPTNPKRQRWLPLASHPVFLKATLQTSVPLYHLIQMECCHLRSGIIFGTYVYVFNHFLTLTSVFTMTKVVLFEPTSIWALLNHLLERETFGFKIRQTYNNCRRKLINLESWEFLENLKMWASTSNLFLLASSWKRQIVVSHSWPCWTMWANIFF